MFLFFLRRAQTGSWSLLQSSLFMPRPNAVAAQRCAPVVDFNDINTVAASTRLGEENVVSNVLYLWCGGLKPRIITKRLTQTGKWNEDNWTKRKRIHEADLLTLLHVPKTKGRAHRLKATEDWTDYEHALNIKQEKGFTWQELMRTRERHD